MRSSLIFAIASLPFIDALTVSKSGSCGAQSGLTCKNSVFGSCCSQHNYCGSSSAYCGTGCQSGYGTCGTTTPPVTPAKVSTDGTCGGFKGYTCLNSQWGNCCSQYGYCGKTSAYCGTGCNLKFGTCTSSTRTSSTSTHTSTRTSSTAAPASTLKVSTSARCGKGGFEAFTCSGSKYGSCCSQYSYCGSTDAYCGKGCQEGFGNCNPTSSSSSFSSSTVRSSTTSSQVSSSSSSSSSSAVITSSSSTLSSTSAIPTSETPSSSSSAAPSTTTSTVQSSSSTGSSSSSSSSISSSELPSTTISTTTSTAAASSCVPTQTNAAVNPSFETGSLAPWTVALTGDWEDLRVVGGRPHAGTFYYFGASDSPNLATITMTQTGILVADGTIVDCSMWIYADRNPGYTTTFTISLDGVQCGGNTVVSTGYIQVGGQVQVSGDTHVVTIAVASSGADEASMIFGVDDISITPISGPGASGGCPVPVITSSVI